MFTLDIGKYEKGVVGNTTIVMGVVEKIFVKSSAGIKLVWWLKITYIEKPHEFLNVQIWWWVWCQFAFRGHFLCILYIKDQ